MSSLHISRSKRTRSRGSGSTSKSRMPSRWASSTLACEVEEIDQGPARLGNRRIELQRFFPAVLGQVIPLLLVVGFAHRESHHGGFPGCAGSDPSQVIQGELRLGVGPVHGELGHEQVRSIVTGEGLKIKCHELLCPIEPAFPRQRTDRAEIRRRMDAAPGHPRTGSHQDGQNRQDEADRGARS